MITNLCAQKNIYNGKNQTKSKLEEKRTGATTNLYFVAEKCMNYLQQAKFEVLNNEPFFFFVFKPTDFEIFSNNNRTLWKPVEENGICYNYESFDRTNGSYTFVPSQCGFYVPSICSGQPSLTCN